MGRHGGATKTLFLKRNALRLAGLKPRVICETPVGSRWASDCLLEPLAAFIDGKNAPDLPDAMPDGLGEIAGQLVSHELAACALAALLNAIYAGGNDRNTAAATQQLKIKMGEILLRPARDEKTHPGIEKTSRV